jgi:hypothetical protein
MTKRFIFASLLIGSLSMFSFFLASADPEEEAGKYVVALRNCGCEDAEGVIHVYAYYTRCETGGDQPCSSTACPAPPTGCS